MFYNVLLYKGSKELLPKTNKRRTKMEKLEKEFIEGIKEEIDLLSDDYQIAEQQCKAGKYNKIAMQDDLSYYTNAVAWYLKYCERRNVSDEGMAELREFINAKEK